MALPCNAWTPVNCIVDIADCPRNNWYAPDYLLRCLAREFRDGHAQWLAEQIDEANVDRPAARWLNLICFDPALKPRSPADLPTLRHFADMGIVSARSDWFGDESLVVFKCGPAIGHEATDRFNYDPGGGPGASLRAAELLEIRHGRLASNNAEQPTNRVNLRRWPLDIFGTSENCLSDWG